MAFTSKRCVELRACLVAMLLAAMGGCASVVAPPGAAPVVQGGQPPPAVTINPANQRAALPAELVVERQWLQSWFEGTPVTISLRGTHSMTIDIPRQHCFDTGSTRIRPALAAVLDKLAQSLRRLPYSNLAMIAAPEDGGAGRKSLGVQRATRIQRHLRSIGVPAAKLGKPSVTTAEAVQMRIDIAEP